MAKGSQYEREFCKAISVWWSRSGDDDLFWRTHGSGARATSRTGRGLRTAGQYGDICAVDKRGQSFTDVVTVSLKRGYPKANISDLMDAAERSAEPQLSRWFKECIRDHTRADSFGWMLVIRRNTKKDFVFIPLQLYQELRKSGATGLTKCSPQVQFIWKAKKERKYKNLRKYILNNAVVWGTTLENFLKEVSRDDIVKIAKKHRRSKV